MIILGRSKSIDDIPSLDLKELAYPPCQIPEVDEEESGLLEVQGQGLKGRKSLDF